MAKKKAKRNTEKNLEQFKLWTVWIVAQGYVVMALNEKDAMLEALRRAEEEGTITGEWEGVTALVQPRPSKLFALRDDDSKPWEITR